MARRVMHPGEGIIEIEEPTPPPEDRDVEPPSVIEKRLAAEKRRKAKARDVGEVPPEPIVAKFPGEAPPYPPGYTPPEGKVAEVDAKGRPTVIITSAGLRQYTPNSTMFKMGFLTSADYHKTGADVADNPVSAAAFLPIKSEVGEHLMIAKEVAFKLTQLSPKEQYQAMRDMGIIEPKTRFVKGKPGEGWTYVQTPEVAEEKPPVARVKPPKPAKFIPEALARAPFVTRLEIYSPTYKERVIEGAKKTAEAFGTAFSKERWDEIFAAFTGKAQKKYIDSLAEFNADALEYNAQVNELNKSVEAIELQGEKLPFGVIDDYNKAVKEVEDRVPYLDRLAAVTDNTNPAEVDRYNRQIAEFNRMVAKLQDKEPEVNQALDAIKDFNERAEKLELEVGKLKVPVEPKAPPKDAPTVVRGVYEGIKKEYKIALDKGQDTGQKIKNVAGVTAETFVPLVWLKEVKDMSAPAIAINSVIDAIILVPLLGVAGLGIRSVIRAGVRGTTRHILTATLADTRAAIKVVKKLYGGDVASAMTTVSNSQIRLYKQLMKLERLKAKLKSTVKQERVIIEAEKSLRNNAKIFIDKLTNVQAKVVSQGEATLQKKWGMSLSTTQTARLKPGLTLNAKDIVEYTRDLAKAAAGQKKIQPVKKIEQQIADTKLKMKLPSNDPLFQAERFSALQRRLYLLNTKLAQARMYDMSDVYRQLLATRQRIGELYSTRANLKARSNIKSLDREIIDLMSKQQRLEHELQFGLTQYSARYSAEVPKQIAKLQKLLVEQHDDLLKLEKKLVSLKKTRATLVSEASRKQFDSSIAKLESQIVKGKIALLKTKETLVKSLKTLEEFVHPAAPKLSPATPRVTTATIVQPRTGVSVTPRITGTVVKGSTREAAKVLESTLIIAIGRPLSKTEFKTFTHEVVLPATIRKIATEVQRKAKAMEKAAMKPVTKASVEAAVRRINKEVEEIMKQAVTEIQPKIQAAPKPRVAPVPVTKIVTPTKTPVKPVPPPPKIPPPKPPIRLRVLPLPFRPKEDKAKRKRISQSDGAVGWKHGKLHGKRIWHVIMSPYQSEDDHVTVIGRKPPNTTIVDGPGSAAKTVKLLFGKPPSKRVTGDIGFFDFALEPRGAKKIFIEFKPDPKLETTGDITIGKRKIKR